MGPFSLITSPACRFKVVYACWSYSLHTKADLNCWDALVLEHHHHHVYGMFDAGGIALLVDIVGPPPKSIMELEMQQYPHILATFQKWAFLTWSSCMCVTHSVVCLQPAVCCAGHTCIQARTGDTIRCVFCIDIPAHVSPDAVCSNRSHITNCTANCRQSTSELLPTFGVCHSFALIQDSGLVPISQSQWIPCSWSQWWYDRSWVWAHLPWITLT